MAALLTCDYCGEMIGEDECRAALSPLNIGAGGTVRNVRFHRDYHASKERDCLGAVLDVVELAESVSQLPTTGAA